MDWTHGTDEKSEDYWIIPADEYRKLLKKNPDAPKWGWKVMQRDPVVFVRGKVSHPDHTTIRLDLWHLW